MIGISKVIPIPKLVHVWFTSHRQAAQLGRWAFSSSKSKQIEVDSVSYHFVTAERGQELERHTTFEIDEHLYDVFQCVTFELACINTNWNTVSKSRIFVEYCFSINKNFCLNFHQPGVSQEIENRANPSKPPIYRYLIFWQLPKIDLCVKLHQIGVGLWFQLSSLAQIKNAQQSVHLTSGSLRVFQAVSRL
jgi:hypothetical protein